MEITMIIGLLGGLGLFLFGMQIMAEGLQKAAGERLRSILELFTSRPITAVFTGAVATMLLQSSSTTTVMVVGFVNSGLMTLSQAVGTIMGANIGTTITAQVVSFDIYALALPLIALGSGLNFFAKRKKMRRYVGTGMLGFGLLLLGLSTMSSAVYPLRSYEPFLNALIYLGERPFLGILAGMLFTVLVQSSSATTGLVIAFSLQGVISLSAGLVLIVGANLGTCVTALLAALGASVTAKRAALSHVLFNAFGVLLFLVFRAPFTRLVALTGTSITRQIANAHTFFNVINTLILFPFIEPFVRLVTALVPGQDLVIERRPKYLDRRVVRSPAALLGASKETIRMAEIAIEMVEDAVDSFISGDLDLIPPIEQREEVVNDLEKAITAYLAEASQEPMNHNQARQLTNLMHIVNDVERLGDHAINIADLAVERSDHDLTMSEEAAEDLLVMCRTVVRICQEAISALKYNNVRQAIRLTEEDDLVDEMEKRYRINHIQRLNEGRCHPESGVLFLDVVSNLERVGDHANNIAQAVAGTAFPQDY